MRLTTLPLLSLLLATTAMGQIERQHDSHEHGRADLQLAWADGRLELELTAPGSDIVGFEHAPGDASQQQAIDSALAVLGDGSAWLSFSPAQACRFTGGGAHTHGFKNGGEHAHDEHDGHDEHHDHDSHHHGDADHEGVGHGAFHVALTAECASAPAAIQVDLRRHFPAAARIRVDFLTDDHQGRVELDAGQGVVRLQP
jgi:hypothetical protein